MTEPTKDFVIHRRIIAMPSQEPRQQPAPGPVNRRRFLKLIGIGTGATVLTCAGAGAVATYAPTARYPESAGAATGSPHVLVTYASVRGSTGEVAQAIAETLSGRGFSVDLHPIRTGTDLSSYDAVLVGSAIRMSKWLPVAATFVKNHRDTLSRIPTSYFTVCLALAEDTEERRSRAYAYLEPIRQMLQ